MIVLVAKALGAQSLYPDEFETSTTVYTATIADDLMRWIQSVLDYIQDPTSFVFGITEPVGNFLLTKFLEPLRLVLVETPWFFVLAGFSGIAYVVSGLRPAITTLLMLDRDRRDGRLGRGDGHRLAGARGDRPGGVLRDPDRGLGRRERTRGAAAADRCWTRSRRCRSWSTSSRSST